MEFSRQKNSWVEFSSGILEWVVIPFSRGSFQTRGRTWVSCIAGRFFTVWAITTHYFNQGSSQISQSYGFSSSHVWMWELDYKESWVLKNWYFWTVVLEKTLESPLDCKEIQPVHPKGNQSWIFIGRTDAEAETPILWPPDVKNWLIWKDPDAGKDWRREEKGMIGWDGWMASPTQWTWVWVNFGSWWRTGRPGVLQSMGSQRVGHDWEIELNWQLISKLLYYLSIKKKLFS